MKVLDEYEIALQYGTYIERDVYSKLLKWKEEDARDHKCLFLRGARRVGKSCLALEFAHKEYKSFIKISFDKASSEIKELFTNSLEDLDYFYDQLSIAYDTILQRGESLIILDEMLRAGKLTREQEDKILEMAAFIEQKRLKEKELGITEKKSYAEQFIDRIQDSKDFSEDQRLLNGT